MLKPIGGGLENIVQLKQFLYWKYVAKDVQHHISPLCLLAEAGYKLNIGIE
jgi:hypothetical protein